MEVSVIFMLNVNMHQQKSGQGTESFPQERPILSFLHCIRGIVAVQGYIYPLFIYIWVELYFTLYTELPVIQVVWFSWVIISSII